MIVIKDKFNIVLPYKTHIVLGNFDGLHIGHMELIKNTVKNAKLNNLKSMVYTFENHPLSIVNQKLAPKLIINNETKLKFLEQLHIDIVNLVPFDKDYMNIEPVDFINLLIKHYNVKSITVGFNFKFGKNNLGDVKLLKKLSNELNFNLFVIEPIKINNNIISSTYIRSLISNGKINEANGLLYNNFFLEGKVVQGKHLGSKLGFPTANILVDNNMLVPQKGVYYTKTLYNGKEFKSITNVGWCPTVDGKHFTIETNILNFNENIYNKNLKINFIKKIRDEFKFNNVSELVNQINKDKEFLLKTLKK